MIKVWFEFKSLRTKQWCPWAKEDGYFRPSQESESAFSLSFCSIQPLNRLDDWSTQIYSEMFYQPSGHPLSQSCWHIKFIFEAFRQGGKEEEFKAGNKEPHIFLLPLPASKADSKWWGSSCNFQAISIFFKWVFNSVHIYYQMRWFLF